MCVCVDIFATFPGADRSDAGGWHRRSQNLHCSLRREGSDVQPEAGLHAGAEAEGHGYVTPAMSRMFGLMGKEPVSLSELARRLIVSRQAVHQMANEALRRILAKSREDPAA